MVNLSKVKAYIFAIDSKHTKMQLVSFAISGGVKKLETPATTFLVKFILRSALSTIPSRSPVSVVTICLAFKKVFRFSCAVEASFSLLLKTTKDSSLSFC